MGLRYPALKVKRAGACPAAWGPALPAVKEPAKTSTICRIYGMISGEVFSPLIEPSEKVVKKLHHRYILYIADISYFVKRKCRNFFIKRRNKWIGKELSTF
jgi:hypothetical protein